MFMAFGATYIFTHLFLAFIHKFDEDDDDGSVEME